MGNNQATAQQCGGLSVNGVDLLLLGCACALTALLTAWARRHALRRKLLDWPGARRSHQQPTPRGGGVSVAAVLLLVLLAGALVWPQWRWPALLAATGLVLVAGIGWWDDHRPLAIGWRLGVHALAAVLLGGAVACAGGVWWQALLSGGAALVLVNVWNFMDGIDGLAASQAVIAATGYALTGAPGAALGWVLAAALAGFLPFNFPRARIFLGDVGSGAIGYALALLAALNLLADAVAPWLLLLPVSVFLTDAALTLLRRILRGECWWQAHVQHAYQRWANARGSHVRVTIAYAFASAIAVMLMLSKGHSKALIILAWWGCLGVAWWRVQRRYRDMNGKE